MSSVSLSPGSNVFGGARQPRRSCLIASGLDSAIAAYQTLTGASDLTGLKALVFYLKAQSLWDHVRFASFKSAQNKGSGATVYALGGWTSNHITLTGSPTWGAGGIAFDAVDDRGAWNLTGVESLATLIIFSRQAPSGASAADTQRYMRESVGSFATGAIHEFCAGISTSYLSGETFSIGYSSFGASPQDMRIGSNALTWTANEDACFVSEFSSAGKIWKNKTEPTINLRSPSGATDCRPLLAQWSTDSILRLNAIFEGTFHNGFTSGTRKALLCCKTTLTQTQRESITDLLNAL